jgi:hypothetical protein
MTSTCPSKVNLGPTRDFNMPFEGDLDLGEKHSAAAPFTFAAH